MNKFRDLETDRDGQEGNVTLPAPSKKQSIQALYYCTAIFNMDLETIKSILIPICKKFICGEEICPTTGKKHYQTFISLNKKMRPEQLDKLIKSKWFKCNGNEESNIKYCSKDGIIYKYGYPQPIKIINKLRDWQANIENIYFEEPDDRKIYWFWDDTGNIGKSAFVKYMIVKHKVLFCSGGKHTDIMNLVFNQDMNNCKAVFFDIPRSHKGRISYASLECIKNGMVCNTKYETGVKIFNPPHLFIFANFPPENPEEISIDRWIITKLEI